MRSPPMESSRMAMTQLATICFALDSPGEKESEGACNMIDLDTGRGSDFAIGCPSFVPLSTPHLCSLSPASSVNAFTESDLFFSALLTRPGALWFRRSRLIGLYHTGYLWYK